MPASRHPITSDCVACWRLDEPLASDNAIDATGNGHTGVQSGNPGVFPAGKFGSSRDISGTGQLFTIADAPDLRLQTITVCGWIYFDSEAQPNFYKMVFKDHFVKAGAVYLQGPANPPIANSGMEWLLYFTDGTAVVLNHNDPLAALVWHHIAGVFDTVEGFMAFYIDGGLHKVTTVDHVGGTLKGKLIDYDGDVWALGRDPDWATQALNGKLDDIAIYNTAKSAEWIRGIWRGFQTPRVLGNRAQGEYCLTIGDSKHNSLTEDGTGELIRDYTIQSRARFRLTCRRGEWWANSKVGSLFHTLNTLGQAKRQAQAFAQQALQDLIDADEILSVTVTEIEENPIDGTLLARVQIEVPEGEAIDLGLIPVGA